MSIILNKMMDSFVNFGKKAIGKRCNFTQTQCTEIETHSDCSMRPRPQMSFNQHVYNHHISCVKDVACTSYFYFRTSFFSIKALPALRHAQVAAMANEDIGQKQAKRQSYFAGLLSEVQESSFSIVQ